VDTQKATEAGRSRWYREISSDDAGEKHKNTKTNLVMGPIEYRASAAMMGHLESADLHPEIEHQGC
jgi:hypothetical protein